MRPRRFDVPPKTRNTVQGNADTVVQVGQVSGDVVIHSQVEVEHTPRQLPSVSSGFVDRDAATAKLDAASQGLDRAKILVVNGMAGVGKTALARHWARRSADRFPGGQLYVDYATIRTESRTPVSDALAECLHALGVSPQHIPATLSARANLFRSRTAARPLLVVLDDVTEPAQVPPFVPSANGSVVLVTSTGKLAELAFDGAVFLKVEPLPDTCGIALLRDICGDRVLAEDEAARRLVAVSAGLPVALRVIGARLATCPALTTVSLADELTDENTRLARLSLRGVSRVSAVFDNAYRALSPDAARLYRLLGAAPLNTFSLETAAVAVDLSPNVARHLLDALVEASLLEDAPAGGYVLHDLVRLHAREHSRPDERRMALVRLMSHYLRMAAFADQAVMGQRTRIADHRVILGHQPAAPFTTSTAALSWLVLERSNLLVLLRAMAATNWHDQTWQLAEALTALYLNRRYLDDWIESSELGAAAARRAGNERAEARLRSVVSRAYTDIGDFDRARAHLDMALTLAERSNDKILCASVWEFIGRYRDAAAPESSAEAYEQAIRRNDEAGERRGAAIATYFLGCAVSSRGNQTEALPILQRARRLLTEIGDKRMAGRGSISLGLAYLRCGNTTAAREELEQAVDFFASSEATHYEAQAREALADVAVEAGDQELARAQLQRVLSIREASGAPDVDAVQERLRGLHA